MNIRDFTPEIFRLFDRQWALLTAGSPDDFHTMTVSWRSLGSLWGAPDGARPIATVYVRPARYTYELLEKNEFFTLTFFPEQYRDDLRYLGEHSGRDGDKLAATSLTPVPVEGGVGFREAKLTFVCRKIFHADFETANMPADVAAAYYPDPADPPHRMYIGEIVEMIEA